MPHARYILGALWFFVPLFLFDGQAKAVTNIKEGDSSGDEEPLAGNLQKVTCF